MRLSAVGRARHSQESRQTATLTRLPPLETHASPSLGANNIAPSQLYAWNPVLGADGSACSTALWAEESYCVGTGAGAGSVSATTSGQQHAETSSLAVSSGGTPTQVVPSSTLQGSSGADIGPPSSTTGAAVETTQSALQSSDAVTSGVPYSVSNTNLPATQLSTETVAGSSGGAASDSVSTSSQAGQSGGVVTITSSLTVTLTVDTCTAGASAVSSTP